MSTILKSVVTLMALVIVVLGGMVGYLVTDTHLVQCEVHTSLAFDDQDGEPVTWCYDVFTGEQIS